MEIFKKENELNVETIIDFLYTNLGEYRDEKSAIKKSIDYAFSLESAKGGFILGAYDEGSLVGALVMNQTGMEEFIPENILVYIAVDETKRGQGIGRSLINKAVSLVNGDIALHVEYDNPAKNLYELLGFKSKYAEMRYLKRKVD
jgi:ribosomal protein S18 acetylase RimI-like enzyme